MDLVEPKYIEPFDPIAAEAEFALFLILNFQKIFPLRGLMAKKLSSELV